MGIERERISMVTTDVKYGDELVEQLPVALFREFGEFNGDSFERFVYMTTAIESLGLKPGDIRLYDSKRVFSEDQVKDLFAGEPVTINGVEYRFEADKQPETRKSTSKQTYKGNLTRSFVVAYDTFAEGTVKINGTDYDATILIHEHTGKLKDGTEYTSRFYTIKDLPDAKVKTGSIRLLDNKGKLSKDDILALFAGETIQTGSVKRSFDPMGEPYSKTPGAKKEYTGSLKMEFETEYENIGHTDVLVKGEIYNNIDLLKFEKSGVSKAGKKYSMLYYTTGDIPEAGIKSGDLRVYSPIMGRNGYTLTKDDVKSLFAGEVVHATNLEKKAGGTYDADVVLDLDSKPKFPSDASYFGEIKFAPRD